MANLTDTLVNGSLRVTGKIYGNVPTAPAGTNTEQIASTAFVTTAIENLPEPMIFKGSLGTGGTITTLPAAAKANEGFTYKVITDGTYASKAAKVGDTFISTGSAWELIPSGDEPSGTVTSVGLTGAGPITVTGSPITSSGTLALSFGTTAIANGGTGATTQEAAQYNIIKPQAATADLDNNKRFTFISENPSNTNQLIYYRTASTIWSWIKGKLSSDTAVNISGSAASCTGDAATASAAKSGSALETAINGKAASNHTHGNITNDGKLQTNDIDIANGDKLVVTDASDSNKVSRASISFDGTTETQALTKKGTWKTFLTDHQDISGKLNKSGDVMTGALEIQDTQSVSSYANGGGAFHNEYANILLRGNATTGVSGIVFTSSKGTTSVNQPSDKAFIQYHPMGVTTLSAEGNNPTLGTSGEANKLVIGVGNDSDDMVYIQAPAKTGIRHIAGTSNSIMLDADNYFGYVDTRILGQCDTAAATAAKTVTLPGYFLRTGSVIRIKVNIANTAASALTLNVNSGVTGNAAKTIKILTASNTWTTTSATVYTLAAGNYDCYYDGTNWLMMPTSSNVATVSNSVAILAGQAAYATKNVFAEGFRLASGESFKLYVDTPNTSATALKLNVNNTGEKPLYINNVATSTSSYTFNSNWYTVYYDGTNYYANAATTANKFTSNYVYYGTTASYPAWAANKAYAVNDNVTYSGEAWTCTTAHTSGASWSSTNWSRISAVALTTTIPGITEYKEGLVVSLNFACLGGESSTTVNINNLGAKTLTRGTNAWTRGLIGRNGCAIFTYNGSNFSAFDYNTNDTSNVIARMLAVYCSTGASTVAKVGSYTNYVLITGDVLRLRMNTTNTANSPTMNVASTGAKPIAVLTASNTWTVITDHNTANIASGNYYMLYNGTNWYCLPAGQANANMVNQGEIYSQASYAIKSIFVAGFRLVAGAQFDLRVSSANTSKTALQLNVNMTGAKPLYIDRTITSTTNYTLNTGWYKVYYDGENYQLCANTGTAYWRPITVNSELKMGSYAGTTLDFKNGTNTTVEYETGGHIKINVASAPASDVSSWAKASSKPSYTAAEVTCTAAKYGGSSNVSTTQDALNALSTAVGGKQATLDTQTVYTAKGSATKVPQITTNSLGQVTSITEVTITNTDTKQNVTLGTTTKAYITGVSTAPTSTAQALTGIADNEVYLTTTAGQLNATSYKVADTATMQFNTTDNCIEFVF